MPRKEGPTGERKLWKTIHRAVHLPRISLGGAQSHHPGNSEGKGPHHHLEAIDEGHRPHRVSPILITMYRSKRQTIEARSAVEDRTLPHPQRLPPGGQGVTKIAMNFMRGDLRRCRIAMRVVLHGVKSEMNVKVDIQNRGVKRV